MSEPTAQERHDPRVIALKAGLLAVWALVSFVVCFFARDLEFTLGPWQFSYWMAAQGSLFAFILIVATYAWVMRRLAPEDDEPDEGRGGA